MKDIKKLVREGYNIVANDPSYGKKSEEYKLWIYEHFKSLVGKGSVLELGCGDGYDIGADLIKTGFDYMGIDISDTQIYLARENAGEQYFKRADMYEYTKKLDPESLDGIITMFADFHTPRGQRAQLYVNIHKALKKGGYLFLTCNPEAWEGYIENYAGAKMYWSMFSREWYEITLRDLGFDPVSSYTREFEHRPGNTETQVFLLYRKI